MAKPIPPPDGLLQHAGFLRALAQSLLGDAHDAEDVVQGTFLAALERPPRSGSNLRAWLATVARNLAFRKRRSRTRRQRRETGAPGPRPLSSPGEVAARLELQRRMTAAVRALAEPYRSAILHRYFDGHSPAEIAAASGTPVRTVKSRLYRALTMLRAQLDSEYNGDRTAWSLLMAPWIHHGATGGAATGIALAGALGVFMKKAIVVVLVGAVVALLIWSSSEDGSRSAADRQSMTERAQEAEADASTPVATGRSVPIAPNSGGVYTFSGRVVNADGAGVAGARVALLFVASGPAGPESVARFIMPDEVLRREAEQFEEPATTTDTEGRFRITRPFESSSCLRATAEGYAATFAGPVVPGAFTTVTVHRSNPVRVLVRDPEGGALAGADVRIETSAARGQTRQTLAEVRTGADGIAQLPSSKTRELLLVVEPNRPDLGYVERIYEPGSDVIEVTVPRVPMRTVRLVDATTNAPLTDGYLTIGSSRGTPSFSQDIARRRFLADAEGLVRYPNQDGYYGRYVTAPGYEILPLDRDLMPLRRSMRIDGIVKDPEGRPVAGAPVLVAGLGNIFERVYVALPSVSAWTGADGRFSLEIKMLTPAHHAVPDPGVRTLIALLPPHAPAVQDNTPIRPGTRIGVELRATRAARVTVVVKNPAGAPLPGKLIQLRRTIPRAPTWSSVQPDYGVALLSLTKTMLQKTDQDGRIELSPLPAGNFRMHLEHTRRAIALRAGEHKHIEVVWGAGDAVFGRVVDSAGEPVAGINVGLAGTTSWILQTDADGRFRFDEVERGEGDYLVSVWGAGKQARMRIPVELNRENTILTAGPARLRLLVAGPALGEVEFAATPEQGLGVPPGTGFLQVEHDGTTLDLAPGRGIVIVRAKGWGWKAVAYEAAANDVTEVRLAMQRVGSVTGRLNEIPKAPHVTVQLTPTAASSVGPAKKSDALLAKAIQRTFGRTSRNVKPDGDGRFSCDDLNPGSYRARLLTWNATKRAWTEVASTPVTVESGTATTVHFDKAK